MTPKPRWSFSLDCSPDDRPSFGTRSASFTAPPQVFEALTLPRMSTWEAVKVSRLKQKNPNL